MPKLSTETATALKIATVYAVVGGAYILGSSGYFATSAISKESLASVEVWKGLGFIAVTSAILFGSVALTLKRRSERDRLISGVFNAIDDAVLLIDRHSLQVLDCSPSTRTMLGVDASRLRRDGFGLLFDDAEALDTVREAVTRGTENGGSRHLEVPVTAASGDRIHARLTVTTFDWNGTTVALLSISDASEHKRAETALQRQTQALSERLKELRGLYAISRELADVTRTLSDRLTSVVETIPSAWQYPGRTVARVVWDGRSLESKGFEEGTRHQSAVIKVGGQSVGSVDVYVRWDDGGPGEAPFLPEEQDLLEEIARRIGLSIEQDRHSEQQRAALKAARESERRFQTLSEAVPLPVLVSERETGRVLYTNTSARAMIGPNPPGGIETTFFYDRPEERAEVLETLEKTGRIAGRELKVRNPSGQAFWVQVFAETIDFDDTRAIITTFLDVTDKKRAEEAFRHAQKMETIGRLTGGVAHDFNNLLTVIIGNADFLVQEAGDPQIRKWAENLKLAAERGALLTQRLLATSRQQTLQPVRFDPNTLLGGMIDLLNRTLGEDVTVTTAFEADPWSAHADVPQVEQAILNLAINARDAMPSGGKLTLATERVSCGEGSDLGLEPGDYVRIAVSDAGSGIPADQIDRVFDPFFTTKEIGKGTGLGLSMVYGFARQSGGIATIDSEPDKGTTVSLYLPRAKAEPVAERVPPPQASQTAERTGHILVVEDEGLVRDAVVAQLRRLGHEVTAARNADEALSALAEETTVDLLFTDIVMPGGMSGIDLAERAVQRAPSLKILFTTGYTDHAALARLDGFGETRLLQKPYGAAELGALISDILGAHAAGGTHDRDGSARAAGSRR